MVHENRIPKKNSVHVHWFRDTPAGPCVGTGVRRQNRYHPSPSVILKSYALIQTCFSSSHLIRKTFFPVFCYLGLKGEGRSMKHQRKRAEELRAVIAITRHGDRTPKQKMKMKVSFPEFLAFYNKYSPGELSTIRRPCLSRVHNYLLYPMVHESSWLVRCPLMGETFQAIGYGQ